VPFLDGIKVVGSAGSTRHPAFPNLPTLDEVGIKNATSDYWLGVLAPPNLPKPITDRLITELRAVYKDPEAIAKIQATAKIAPEQNPLAGEAFRKKTIDTEAMWKALVTEEKLAIPN
jgi:tripartite-type tricarboxylate transporter receptor subunit TctC